MHLVSRGSGYPILFIHGMPTNSRLWNGIIERLLGRYTCYAIDLPGLGKSPRIQYGPQYLRSLAEKIDALRIRNSVAKWHVVGHDAGSAVAVHYARYFQQNIDCMALLSPALFPELRPYYLIEPLRKPILGEVLAPLIKVLFWKVAMQRALGGDPEGDQTVKDFYERFSGPAGAWQFMRLMRWGKPSDILAEVPAFLPRLLVPTLILQGLRDCAIPMAFARRASSLIPNSRMMTLDSGHFIPLHQPESVAMTLHQFFDRQSRQREVHPPA